MYKGLLVFAVLTINYRINLCLEKKFWDYKVNDLSKSFMQHVNHKQACHVFSIQYLIIQHIITKVFILRLFFRFQQRGKKHSYVST